MAEYIFTINGTDYKVDVKNIENNIAEIAINEKIVYVNIKQLGISQVKKRPVKKAVEEPVTQVKKASGTQSVSAPLPGVILEVKVKEGDAVKEGQDLMIMEAMKMENSIQAPCSGTVKKILVNREATVQEGDTLVEIGS